LRSAADAFRRRQAGAHVKKASGAVASRIPFRRLRHVNENTTAARQISRMLELPLDQTALNVLRQALNADADPEIARIVVLRKLAGMYRSQPECELRNALARAWALYRRERRIRLSSPPLDQ
jgi:hypothetical protein